MPGLSFSSSSTHSAARGSACSAAIRPRVHATSRTRCRRPPSALPPQAFAAHQPEAATTMSRAAPSSSVLSGLTGLAPRRINRQPSTRSAPTSDTSGSSTAPASAVTNMHLSRWNRSPHSASSHRQTGFHCLILTTPGPTHSFVQAWRSTTTATFCSHMAWPIARRSESRLRCQMWRST